MVKTFDKLPLPQVKRSDNSDNESGSSDIRKCCGSKYIEFLDPDPEFWPNLNPETELCNTY